MGQILYEPTCSNDIRSREILIEVIITLDNHLQAPPTSDIRRILFDILSRITIECDYLSESGKSASRVLTS